MDSVFSSHRSSDRITLVIVSTAGASVSVGFGVRGPRTIVSPIHPTKTEIITTNHTQDHRVSEKCVSLRQPKAALAYSFRAKR
jgi:hypothetical protein